MPAESLTVREATLLVLFAGRVIDDMTRNDHCEMVAKQFVVCVADKNMGLMIITLLDILVEETHLDERISIYTHKFLTDAVRRKFGIDKADEQAGETQDDRQRTQEIGSMA